MVKHLAVYRQGGWGIGGGEGGGVLWPRISIPNAHSAKPPALLGERPTSLQSFFTDAEHAPRHLVSIPPSTPLPSLLHILQSLRSVQTQFFLLAWIKDPTAAGTSLRALELTTGGRSECTSASSSIRRQQRCVCVHAGNDGV